MPISYKHKIYTTLGTPTVLSGDVVSATDNAGVPAKDYTVKGKSIVWNQMLDKSKYPVTTTTNGVTFTNNGDGSITVNGTADAAANAIILVGKNLSIIQGHKYYATMSKPIEHNDFWFGLYDNSEDQPFQGGTILDRNGRILDCIKSSDTLSCQVVLYKNKSVSNAIVKPQLFDLTQMFGAGNEPATVAEFRAMFPDDYYPYNAGELKSVVPTSVETSGINLLNLVGRKEISPDTVGFRTPTDAYPEIDTHVYYKGFSPNGYLMGTTVAEATVLSSSVIVKTGTSPASASYGVGVPLTVVPSTTYYIKCTTSGVVNLGYANSNKVITSFGGLSSNNQFTTPGDCRYVLIVFKPNAIDALATFENICVSAVQTNEYQPYNKYRANIPSSKYFPDGMKSAGSVYDEINFLSQKAIKRIGAVDMGTLNWSYYVNKLRFHCNLTGIKRASSTNTIGNIVCSKYVARSLNSVSAYSMDKIIAVTDSTYGFDLAVYDTAYTNAAAFKAAMSGVMLYYELATPVETTITPPLQALSTYKGFTSFSAPNSLTQNGPLSVAYYAEGGTNPEKGWLTSYKRKLYMGRTIVWNQLRTNQTSSGSGSTSVQYAKIGSAETSLVYGHKYYVRFYVKYGAGNTNNSSVGFKLGNFGYSEFSMSFFPTDSFVLQEQISTLNSSAGAGENRSGFIKYSDSSKVLSIEWKNLQIFNLTKMFGAGNEPSTPEEFWSYFDHKLYPYNAGETQPLFKISRKSYIYKEPAGYTVYFVDGIWIADTVTISVEYADGSTETLTSQNDMGGKSRSNVVKMTFTDTNSDRYVRYKMPANGGSEETLNLWPTATLVLTADAEIEEIGK